MSEELLNQWRDRVLEAETEISIVQEEIDAVHKRRRAIKQKVHQFDDLVADEKRELLNRLEEVEAEAKNLGERCEATVAEKDQVEATYMRTLDEYEGMHFLVHEIKDAERMLGEREDLDVRLQRESLAWAEEEHSLRTKLNNFQMQLKQNRKQQQTELTELEAELAELERRQAQERAERAGEVKQQARSVVRGSRQPSPRQKEETFLSANSAGGVPTRSAPLRSCIKGQPAGAKAGQAPAARAVSQPLMQEGEGAMSSLEAFQQMRALSYGPGKQPRKRNVLGDATNQQ
ncbi:hypothetical protein STCU_02665 [Strigomonas culicis]|uniref:Uncharacterized protein n=1 Tax=Strigomonas culicis TaxID=28005 RepID=S9UPF3_9TRYP|nr:hypothetical protein STCU_02665 [Strigomonas culicis]|eukprot:EPY32772.1 hypothetical protein STCU_02665 [Strigomonas culicis]